MHQPFGASLRRTLVAICLIATWIMPGAGLATAAEGDDAVLRVGSGQDLDAMNPFETALVIGFEVFTLNYELLVGFGKELEPVPGFAESWEPNAEGTEYTFTIEEGKLWSDGEPATAQDVAWTYQFMLDALDSETGGVCLGYLDQYVSNSGLTAVEATDDQTVVFTLDRQSDRILQSYLPILPMHIWGEQTLETICDFQNEAPVIGSGPYQAQEWQTGQQVRFERNPNWTRGDLAASEVVIQFFDNEDTMLQAIRNDELDYVQGLLAEQFDQLQGEADIQTVEASANGFTELGFNTYGTGTDLTIEDGGPSTQALLDPAFRDALGYAIDKPALVDRVLGGYGVAGDSHVPPFQATYYRAPDNIRTFDIEQAQQKLDAAGYPLDDQGRRLDQEGQPIVLDLVFPDSDTTYATAAEFLTAWYDELGIAVNAQQFASDTLIDVMLPPEAEGTADYDLFIWGWGGDVDPNSLLRIFMCEEIGNSSDSLYCNPRYDELFELQNVAPTTEERKTHLDEMQQIIYDEAPYHVLYYDSALHAYRTDRFTNWQNQPEDGTPLFGYGPFGYTQLQLVGGAGASPSAEPSGGAAPSAGTEPSVGTEPSGAASPSAGAAPSAAGATQAPGGQTGQPATSGGVNTGLIAAAVAVGLLVLLGVVLMSRRRRTQVDEE